MHPFPTKLFFFLFCAALAFGSNCFALTGLQIMEEQSRRHTLANEEATFTMTLTDAKGRTRERTMILHKTKADDGQFKSLIQFSAPRDIRGVGLLTWQGGADDSDDQWLYLPATRQVKRIAGSNKKSSFMGTDLAYEDLQREDTSAYDYTIIGEAELDGKPTWIIEATPATELENRESGYEKRKIWIQKDNYLIVQIEYYGSGGKLLKTARHGDHVHIAGETWRGNAIRMQTHASGTQTTLVNVSRVINPDIPEILLTRQGLQRPIRD